METSHRLEAAEARLAEHEALPGWRQYRACCGLYTALTRAGWGGAGLLRGGAHEAEARVIRCRAWLMVDTRLNTEATRLTPRLSGMLQVLMGKTQAGVETE